MLDDLIEHIGDLLEKVFTSGGDAAAEAAAEAAAHAAEAASTMAEAASSVADAADAVDAAATAAAAAATIDPGIDMTGMESGGDLSEVGGGDSSLVDPTLGGLGVAGTPVISGNAEVDDMLSNGIQVTPAGSDSAAAPEKVYKQYRPSFTSAVGCNLCGCKCFVKAAGDGVNAMCICGHPKHQHVWV